ncbi:hypothetical protein WJX74_003669 [Apatococcus lobatus]|uniref:ATP-binding cassette transporter n=1 Tax=Apatococcus lobatus TaxID=904363 RepID=A0AAW1RGX3_9CHLO
MKQSDSSTLLDKPTVRIKVVDTKTPSVNDPGTVSRPLSFTVPKWWRVATLWFRGDEKQRAWTYAAISVTLCLLNTLLLVRVSYAQRMFETALAGKEQGDFYKGVSNFVVIIIFAAPLMAIQYYTEQRLTLEWRRWLTNRLLMAYFSDQTFFRLHIQDDHHIDNPDQRICDDVPQYTDGSVFLVTALIKKLFNCVAFTGVLWSIEPKMVFFLLTYAVVGTWLTTYVFGGRLMQLQYTCMQREGDLRFEIVRTRENAESIAFYKGESREASQANSRLLRLVVTIVRKIQWQAGLDLWKHVYVYATMLLPALWMAPKYFAGTIEFGVISQVGFAFHRIEAALSVLIMKMADFSGLAAQTERLEALLDAVVHQGHEPTRIQQVPSARTQGLSLEHFNLRTPGSGHLIAKALDLDLPPGKSLLIVGPSGCGKSSLLRAISGLWTSGSGLVRCPSIAQMLFLPQKPFMPLGPLRSQILFPSSGPRLEWGQRHGHQPSDKELLGLLDDVLLPDLAHKVGGLETELEWGHVLSLGEQQRMAFLRLLLHQPALAFLDEATGACDENTEAALYGILQTSCQTFVSVGHRMQLLQYHDLVLECTGKGHWQLQTSIEYQQRRASQRA